MKRGLIAAALLLAACSNEPEPPDPSDVEWHTYAPEVRDRVDAALEAEDCEALQAEMDSAVDSQDARMDRTGTGNADLMGYILDGMEYVGC